MELVSPESSHLFRELIDQARPFDPFGRRHPLTNSVALPAAADPSATESAASESFPYP
jgi:hypothetical protein